MTPALAEEAEAATAKMVAAKYPMAALRPSDDPDSLLLPTWALITGIFTLDPAGDTPELILEASSADPAPAMEYLQARTLELSVVAIFGV